MFRYSVFYPSGEGSTFDHDYYRDTHIPLAVGVYEPASYQIDRGVDGPFVASVHMTFETKADLDAAMAAPDLGRVREDVPNYTNIKPIRQISEISAA